MMPMSLSRSLFCLSLFFGLSLYVYYFTHADSLYQVSIFTSFYSFSFKGDDCAGLAHAASTPPPFPNTFSFLYSSSIYLAHLDFRLPFRSTGAGKFSLRAISAIWEDLGGGCNMGCWKTKRGSRQLVSGKRTSDMHCYGLQRRQNVIRD